MTSSNQVGYLHARNPNTATEATLRPGVFYGMVLKRADAPGLKLAEVAYGPGLKTPKHCHERAMLVISLQGISTQMYGNAPNTCRPWTVAFHPPREIHWDHFHAPGVRDLNIEIEPSRLSMFRDHSDVVDRAFASNKFEPRWLAAKIYREFLDFDELSPLAIEGLVIELLVELARNKSCGPGNPRRWLRQAKDIIEMRFAEHFTLEELSSSVGVHPVHLAREFRRYFHCTVGQEVRRLRIEFACRELMAGKRPLNEVALMAGFSDQSHFCRTFKRATGMSPLEFQAAPSAANLPARR